MTAHDIVEIILSFFLPPLAVYLHAHECDIHVLINLLLLIFGWFPAIVHALWYCFGRD